LIVFLMCSPIYCTEANAGEAIPSTPPIVNQEPLRIKDTPVHIHVPMPQPQETPVIIQIPIPDGT
jgi:hypothetical protein